MKTAFLLIALALPASAQDKSIKSGDVQQQHLHPVFHLSLGQGHPAPLDGSANVSYTESFFLAGQNPLGKQTDPASYREREVFRLLLLAEAGLLGREPLELPASAQDKPITMGAGPQKYEWVRNWLQLPEKQDQLGNTHGGIV